MPNSNPLRFRRQFILGPRPLNDYATWQQAPVGPGLQVQVQKDLPLVQIEHDGLKITLLGFVIDPVAPDLGDEAILVDLATACHRAYQVPEIASNLTGRFVMIVDDGTDRLLFHDPCGLREVFHSTNAVAETWCASQPCRIAGPLGFTVDENGREFMASSYYSGHHEPWWPSPSTPYHQLRRLQPNHYLDLRTREAHRFWPNEPLRQIEPEVAAQTVAQLLRSSILAASKRFPLALPLTAGVDSRTILAGTRGIRNVFHYTALRHGLDRHSPDISVPGRLLRRLGIEHHVLECPETMSPEFARIYLANTTGAHEGAGAIAEGLLARYPFVRTTLSGHCSEIARDTRRISHTPAPDAGALARLMGMGNNHLALRCFHDWLETTRPVADQHGYRVRDLFFWEQECGTRAANGQSQWDLVHERFTPFNQRGVLRTLLATDPFFRQPPRYELYRRIMQILWEDVLIEPFNPADQATHSRLRRFLERVRSGSIGPTVLRARSARGNADADEE